MRARITGVLWCRSGMNANPSKASCISAWLRCYCDSAGTPNTQHTPVNYLN
jgi:hypothetical protein